MASEGTPTPGLPSDGTKKDGPAILPLNPGVPIRGIRMKFAVLSGLVDVGEVSNRDILETVFNLLVGGQFDLELNFVVQEAESVTCMVELLDQCEPTCQAEVWSIFSAILRKSLRNLQACTEAGLIQQLLNRLHGADCVIADLMVDMLGALASYSLSPHELKLFFTKLQGVEGKWPPHAVKLLSVLNCIAHRNGPDAFFNFPGKSAAAIALPPIAKWPYLNGFTFQTWVRLDPHNTMNLENDKPYLYCFRTGKGLGYSAHFVGGSLIVTSVKSKGKGIQHYVKYDFKPQKWYMVSIVHVYHRWKNSEIWCYVNGELASYEDVTWLVNTNDTFDKCFLGSSETADSSRVFCGQMGAVYLFSESLNAAQVLGIYQLGPSYKGTFNHSAESDLMLAEHHKMVLYDGKLSGSIAFTYNPRATDAQLCLQSSAKGSPSIFVHSPHALMLQDVRAVLAPPVQSAIHSIGGVQVLFPLFGQLDYPQHTTDQPDTSICYTLLSFLMELLKNSVAMQEQLLASKGFLVIGYSLEKSSKAHVTRPVLDVFVSFARYLSNLPNGIVLLKQLCDHILFNPSIWIHSPAKVQQTLYTYLAAEFISSVAIYNAVRRVGTVMQIMNSLKYYYWAVNPEKRSGVTPRGLDGPRPTHKEILSMRAFLLLFIKQLIVKNHGVKEQELQAILNYLLTMHEDDNLIDVLQLLVAVMSEQPGSMVPTFDRCNGIRVIYKLLASKDEGVRVQALKVLGYFLKYLPPKRKLEIMLGNGLFSLLSERLILHADQSSLTTYNVLFEILTEKISTQVIRKQHLDPDSAVKIVNPQILKVIAVLLKNSPQNPENMEVRRVFLSDMIRVFSNSRENRRSLLQCSVWQEWMLSLCYVSPRNSEEQKVTEMVYALFRILLYHAIKYEWGGWRVWVDTLSISHSKVTFEQHKNSLVSMLQEYERGSNAGGLSPLRTISGSSLSQSNGEHARHREEEEEEEQAPSTVIELTVEGDGEQDQPLVTIPNILSRAVEEEPPAQVEGQDPSVEPAGPAAETPANNLPATAPESTAQTAADATDPAHLQEATEDPVDVSSESGQDKTISDAAEDSSSVPAPIAAEKGEEGNDEQEAGDEAGSEPKEEEQQDPHPAAPVAESTKKTDPPVSEGTETTEPSAAVSKAKEMKIAQLDVSSVASDTAKMELKEQPSENASQGVSALGSAGQGKDTSSTGRDTMFHIPEFQWSLLHQRLLTDLLFAIETDIQMWRSHSTKSVTEFVNSSENVVFVHNTVHLMSQIADNLIAACGGILPLLSAATSSSHELENTEPLQGLAPEGAVAFLQRLMSLADVLIFAGSINFAEVESEKNMSSGGILRQSLRLVCTIAVRNLLDCQEQSALKLASDSAWGHQGAQNIARGARSMSIQCSTLDMGAGDQNLLMQDMDINRLRAAIFRDSVSTEDSKQTQFLALAVVYFISVLMVSKYRDILEPHNEKRHLQRSQSVPCRGAGPGGSEGLENGVSLRRRDSGIGEEQGPVSASDGESAAGGVGECPPGPPLTSPTKSNVKDILRSLVSGTADKTPASPSLLPPAFLGPGADTARDPSLQFRSFDRSVVVAPKKAGAAAFTGSGSSGTPVSNVAVVSSGDATPSGNTEAAAEGDSTSANLPAVPTLAPLTHESASRMSISERLDHALEKAAPLLREIFVDFAPFLSRTLLGSHGQELLNENTSLLCIKSSNSVVELVMLLCSQEWQNSIQKNAGMAFIELVNEGSLLSHNMKDHLVRVAKEAEFILTRQRAEDLQKHREFEAQSAQYSAEKREEEKTSDNLIRAVKYRDHATANQLIQKIVNILTDKHGAWGSSALSRPREFWRLDYWEDDLRRRRRFVRNPVGSSHSEASPRDTPLQALEEDVLKGKQSIRSQALGNQNSQSELLLDGDGDALSSLEEKELENLTGSVILSTGAQLVAPAVAARGTLSITASELYFEVDEEEPSFKKIDPKILSYTEGLHGKWLFSEIRAVFSRRYLLQNTALEIFMANRTSVMFNFPDPATVKKVVHRLPRVGVGTSFGLPQTRRISLASPQQLYKASTMTQRWQRGEISNFEYLIFLNTISGRTYNDLNQYPVFPWVIANYDTNILDLSMPSTYRDLSKPIGALNPRRAAVFSDHFESWEDQQVPQFHYSTHYSSTSNTLTWLQRIEPFTTFLLNLNGGQFDHPDQTFSSVSKAWRSCQRNASDVKELIPEFYYLPEMFVNSNNYELGVMADGTPVSDVDLPPWAKTPEQFVRTNRLALESEFVSSQLHQWIDLIFGYKQKGPEASKALNVFYHLTYEGAVDLDAIDDPALREAAELQIQSFGQTPCQLLTEPHTARSSSTQVTPLTFGEEVQPDVIMVLKFPSNSPVVHVSANTQPGLQAPAIITVTANRLFAVNKWHGMTGELSPSQDQKQQLPVEIDPLLATTAGCQRRQVTDLLDQSIQVHSQCFIITADNRFILLCGFWDRSFRVYSTDSGKLSQIVFGHWDVVTCLARSESYIGGDCYILSGSRDTTLLLWYWNGKSCCIGESALAEFVTPRAVLSGHNCEVTCASVCAELGLAISGSRDGLCLIHSMNGDLLRALEGPEISLRPRLIQSSTEGHCVVYYDKGQFCVFSVNGKLLAQTKGEEQTKAILLSRDGQYLLSGGEAGVLNVWQVHNLKHLFTYPGCDAGIRSMAVSHDQRCIITGMSSGSIVLFHTDFSRWHNEYQSRY
ncbi:hypothetical protein COCON_G00107080 [Conger conger]|uniref:Lipopolysaccharide-responsive and beige-like anchor protein n=1 Tax=Conger conger TaxID=82655 RepID=A0A9Q1DIV7_CONCO|nr:hypothetical protein COCON_G00107080 [Conger conger]